MDPTYQGFGTPVPSKNLYRRRSPGKMIGLIIAGIVVVIIGIVLMMNSGDKTITLQQRLIARLDTLQKIVDEGRKNAKSPDLRELNSVIAIQTLSDATTLKAAMTKAGKPSKEHTGSEADTDSFNELKEAALNSRFDSTYQKVIAGKLDSTNALIKEIHDKTTSNKLRSELNTVYGHFKQLQAQLAATSS